MGTDDKGTFYMKYEIRNAMDVPGNESKPVAVVTKKGKGFVVVTPAVNLDGEPWDFFDGLETWLDLERRMVTSMFLKMVQVPDE